MSDPATLAWYQANAPRYSLSFAQAPSRHLDRFLDRLAPGAHVLELGCARDAIRLASPSAGSLSTRPTPLPR